MRGQRLRSKLKKAGKQTGKCLLEAAWVTCKCALWCCCAPCICLAMLCLPRGRRRPVRDGLTVAPPVPFPRRRALTIPSADWQMDQVTLDQPQSAFITKLPLEIRRMIYEKALGETAILLASMAGVLHAQPCIAMERPRDIDDVRMGNMNLALPLLRTCRLIYSEAVEYLYTANTFTLLTNTDELPTLKHLSSYILPQRMTQIRTIYLDWGLDSFYYCATTPLMDKWVQSWEVLRMLTGLRHLHVSLTIQYSLWSDYYEKFWKEREEELVEPIRRITAPRDFVITLPDRRCSTTMDVGPSRCVLRLPDGDDEETDEE